MWIGGVSLQFPSARMGQDENLKDDADIIYNFITYLLGSVVTIDGNVFMRKITSPEISFLTTSSS